MLMKLMRFILDDNLNAKRNKCKIILPAKFGSVKKTNNFTPPIFLAVISPLYALPYAQDLNWHIGFHSVYGLGLL
jgi:hypothetical protein